MTEEQWNAGYTKAIGIFLNGEGIATPGEQGQKIIDDSFLLFFNAHYETLDFCIPDGLQQWEWLTIIDTTKPRFVRRGKRYTDNQVILVEGRSLILLQRLGISESEED